MDSQNVGGLSLNPLRIYSISTKFQKLEALIFVTLFRISFEAVKPHTWNYNQSSWARMMLYLPSDGEFKDSIHLMKASGFLMS